MGKRELIIIGAFVVVAAVVYQFTAPPPKAGEHGFSLSRVFSEIKQEVTANSKSATTNKTGTIALRPGVAELRLTAMRVVPLTVIGEQRDDVGYELWVESTGPDEATAREYAGRAKMEEDDLGVAQSLRIDFPQEGQQHARLKLRVPHRLLIRVEGAGRVTVSNVHAVDLRNLAGDTTISDVAAQVGGSHRSGELTVSKAGSVELGLSSSRAKFIAVAGAIALKGRNGDCGISQPRGPIAAEMVNVEFTITEPAGVVKVSGENGSLRLVSPVKEFNVDVRRMLVEITLGAAVPGTAITTGEPLRLWLTGKAGVALDAVATGSGAIRASDFDLMATAKAGEARLVAPIGAGGPRVVLRNSGEDIVIALRK